MYEEAEWKYKFLFCDKNQIIECDLIANVSLESKIFAYQTLTHTHIHTHIYIDNLQFEKNETFRSKLFLLI